MTITANGRVVSITVPVVLQTLGSVALGGAFGAVADFFQQGFDFSKIDWHKVAILALTGAIGAVVQHYRGSPLASAPSIPIQPKS